MTFFVAIFNLFIQYFEMYYFLNDETLTKTFNSYRTNISIAVNMTDNKKVSMQNTKTKKK